MTSKTNPGYFFEDYSVGQVIRHGTPRTIGDGERALYTALYPTRFALYSADSFAESCGFPKNPLEDLIGFHTVFGKTVPDISLNAVANLGYAEGRFLKPVWAGDTLSSVSEVIGLKENSNGKTGIVYVRDSKGPTRSGDRLFCASLPLGHGAASVIVAAPAPKPHGARSCARSRCSLTDLVVPEGHCHFVSYDDALAGSRRI